MCVHRTGATCARPARPYALDVPEPRLPAPRGFLRTRIFGAPTVTRKQKAVAMAIAVIADLVQIVVWPAFAEGAASPFDDALDGVVALLLLLTLGWSGRLMAALALELTPGAALFPTWTAVVLSIPVQGEAASAAPEKLAEGKQPAA